MRVNRLALQNFRNYTVESFSFDEKCNVIFGENAQGKTNLLEAIVYLSTGKSPRARSDKEMIAFERSEATLCAEVYARERDFALKTEIKRGRQKKMTVNGVPVKRGGQSSGVLYTVYFCPEDLFLIREGAAARRKFMDTALCQLRPRYAEALSKYHKAYESKTRILRDSEEYPGLLETLPEFDLQMARFGAAIIHYRAQFVARLSEYAALNHEECSGGREALSLRYTTVKTVVDPFAPQAVIFEQLREHQAEHAKAERAARLCLSGPHKDDIEVLIGGRSAKMYSSQGQTRTAALSMKLAEREIYKNVIGEYPVLLLDDVLSELDPKRQEFVLNRISGGQVFITCCEDDRLEELLKGKVFHIHEGALLSADAETGA